MLGHTEAFKRLKTEQQKILDFTVLTCYAIPTLKKAIKGYRQQVKNYETFVKPDYFVETFNADKIEALAQDYKGNLGKYTLLSSFSFFESYVKDVVEELIRFHGGQETFITTLHNRHRIFLTSQEQAILDIKKKLQEPIKKKNRQRYRKYIDEIERQPKYRHPSELLATFGLKSFIEIVTGNAFRSALIPDLLEFAFGMDLSEKVNKHADLVDYNLRQTFDTMRNIRNSIGHGNANDVGFEKVMDLIRFLRHLAVKTEDHLLNHFFILERDQ
ncbi:MAG: hypothetical protein JSS96_00455 [Bacteroidetes bacterium]|nr:hypothetical protein [Bacteroidota bacterium]